MMKQMPYRVEEGAVERAKLRAKMAVREAKEARAVQTVPSRTTVLQPVLRWALSGAAAVVVVIAAISIFMQKDEPNNMELLLSEMRSASEELIYEQMADMVYYAESDSSL